MNIERPKQSEKKNEFNYPDYPEGQQEQAIHPEPPDQAYADRRSAAYKHATSAIEKKKARINETFTRRKADKEKVWTSARGPTMERSGLAATDSSEEAMERESKSTGTTRQRSSSESQLESVGTASQTSRQRRTNLCEH